MIVKLEEDEVYPVYFIVESDDDGREVKVDARVVKRWQRVEGEHERVQTEMKRFYSGKWL